MWKRVVSFLRGSVRVHVESDFPERVLNVCSAHGVAFSQLTWESASAFTFTVARGDLRALRAAVAPLPAELSIRARRGLPFALSRLRRRRALLAGALLCALLFAVNSFFIWDFRVEGNAAVPAERILRELARCGLRRGSFVFSYRSQDLCNRVLPRLPELSWLTVNVRGCCATVVVRERIPRPQIVNESLPTNVVAVKDALVTEVRALDGLACVLPGATVTRGQLLIAGVVDTTGTEAPSVPTRYLAGKGTVTGRTWYELSARIPLTVDVRVPTGAVLRRHALLFGQTRLKLYGKGSSNLHTTCDKIVTRTPWTLFGFALPITWETEVYTLCTPAVRARTRAEAEALGRSVLEAYLASQIDGTVTHARFASAERDGWLLVTLSAECLEQIGAETPILLE